MKDNGEAIVFEQPLNERVRTFLRLEFLFAMHRHYRADRSPWGLRSTLHALLDILSVVGRSDLKGDIIKELSDQSANLSKLADRSGVDRERLQSILAEINAALNAMQGLTTQFASHALRDNEFLLAVLNRSTIPGGTCAFDLPNLHFWLSQPHETVRRDLDAWYADLAPYEQTVALYLKLLRTSQEPIESLAGHGMFVCTPQPHCQLVRVMMQPELGVYPEISAGRHRFTVRFMSSRDVNQRSTQAAADVSFRLQCCVL